MALRPRLTTGLPLSRMKRSWGKAGKLTGDGRIDGAAIEGRAFLSGKPRLRFRGCQIEEANFFYFSHLVGTETGRDPRVLG